MSIRLFSFDHFLSTDHSNVCECACILLTVLKFQTRLKESLFLRLILLSSHTGGNPLTARSTCLNGTATHEKQSHVRLQSVLRGYLGWDTRADSWLVWDRAPACLSPSFWVAHWVYVLWLSHCIIRRCSRSYTHLADRLTRKFHSLADTHTRLRFHSDTPPLGSSNGEGGGNICQSAIHSAARPATSPPSSCSSLFKSQSGRFRCDQIVVVVIQETNCAPSAVYYKGQRTEKRRQEFWK